MTMTISKINAPSTITSSLLNTITIELTHPHRPNAPITGTSILPMLTAEQAKISGFA
jgi:hypothetical protein